MCKLLVGLWFGFFINFVCWVFGMIVFVGISLSDGDGYYEMFVLVIWWMVGIVGFGLIVVIVELVMCYWLEYEV